MTVQAQNSTQYYSGPISVGTVLPIKDFTFIDNSHVSAKIRNDKTVWTYGVDYTVTGANTLDRNFTVLKEVPADKVLAIYLDVPITQGIAPEEGGNFPAATQEFVIDKLTYICQMLQERISRSLQISVDTQFNGTLPELIPNRTFKVNEAGTGLVLSQFDPDQALVVTEVFKDAAEAAASAAESSEIAAEASKQAAVQSAANATQSAANATQSANKAKDWATKMDGTVDDIDYSSKYYANEAKNYVGVGKRYPGEIVQVNASSSYVPENCLYTDGSTYTKTLFPTTYTDWLVGGKLETCTFEEFNQSVAQTGECWKWGLDTATETFKVPKINDIVVRGIADAVTENTLQTQTIKHFVVVATGSINQSQMDWSAWASGQASKANINANNFTTLGQQVISTLSAPSDTQISFTINASGAIYQSPVDGYVVFSKIATSVGQYVCMVVFDSTQTKIKQWLISHSSVAGSIETGGTLRVGKNDIITIIYAATGNVTRSYIVPTNAFESEGE